MSVSRRLEPITFETMFDALWRSIMPAGMRKMRAVFENPLRSHTDRFNLAFSNLQLFKTIAERDVPAHVTAGKSAGVARLLREEGNKAYCQTKDNLAALRLYTKCLAAAPQVDKRIVPSPETVEDYMELSLGYANRSAVLFALGKYEECLADISRALASKYPPRLWRKLYNRRDMCEQKLKDEGSLESETVPDPQGTSNCEAPGPLNDVATTDGTTPQPSLTSGKNRHVPGASNSITPWHCPGHGRCLVATEDINPGDLVILERPYVSSIRPEYYLTHCAYCLRRCDALIPCNNCSLVMYCSSACRDRSHAEHHMNECPVLPSLVAFGMDGNWALALRMLLRAVSTNSMGGLEEVVRKLDVEAAQPGRGTNEGPLYINWPNDYVPIHTLEQNMEGRTMRTAYKLATQAACIVSLLSKHTNMLTAGWFGALPRHELKSFVGGLLLRYLQCVECNDLTVHDLLLSTDPDDCNFQGLGVGSGMYPLTSLLNHSCDANVLMTPREGNILAGRAIRHIPMGHEICRDYGYNYSRHTLDDRKEMLRARYYFECDCLACVENWPQYETLKASQPTIMCPTCSAQMPECSLDSDTELLMCYVCNNEVNVYELRQSLELVLLSYMAIKSELFAGSTVNMVPSVANLIGLISRILVRPCQVLVDLTDLLKHAAMQTGNFYRI